LKLEFSDLVTEITQIINQVTSAKQSKKALNREDIYDRQLHLKRLRLIEELKQCPSGLCETLKTTVKFGIAYHHSGLTNDEKCIIERGYRQGTLLVLVATSTLSTGINLPAKAVLFKTPFIA
jgi:replicative superfamily II helicase